MRYYGIDITQHKEFCISAKFKNDEFHFSKEASNPFLPAALLPEFKHENILMASTGYRSRKGLGLLWPRDAQIPAGGGENWQNGIGRIPLLSCISNIKAAGEADEWKFIESRISWAPHEKQILTFSNAELLSKVFTKLKDAKQSCFVIPEEFGESAQQTLLEKFPEDTLLIPRSIAIAVKWCKEHQQEYQNLCLSIGISLSIGHLVCVSLGFGEWEVSIIEIQAVKIRDEVHLIPIYDPSIRNHGLDFCGIGLCSQLTQKIDDEGTLWRLICNNSWFDKLLANGLDDADKRNLTTVLLAAEKTKLPYPHLEAMAGLRKKHILRGEIKNKINTCLELQKREIQSVDTIIGVAVGGSFSTIPILLPKTERSIYDICPSDSPYIRMSIEQLKKYASLGVFQAQRVLQYRLNQITEQQAGSSTIASFLFPDWAQNKKLFTYGADVFAEGAAIAAYCMSEGLPAFRIKLLPLYLYTIGRNNRGDKVENWECLVSADTLDAGETYHQPKPITGFVIPEGSEHLELTLRRPWRNSEQLYRSVVAKIPQKTEQKESVIITANVRPGQGFAKVNVISERRGIFATHLDWRTMKTVPRPELHLEYIPDVAFIVADSGLWDNANRAIQQFMFNWNLLGKVKKSDVDSVLAALRLWRWDKNSSNIYRNIGALNNDGIENKLIEKGVLKKFQSTLLDAWEKTYDNVQKNRFLRIGGWLYLFIPEEMQKAAELAICHGQENAIHLHVAGLTFHTEEQFKLFYHAFCMRKDHKTEWFRALRNMVRFRDNALSNDVLSDSQMDIILDEIISNLETYPTHTQKKKYNNSIEVLIYLLKRRRYNEKFLLAGDETTICLSDILHGILKNHPTEKYRKIAKETLAFLNKEATAENLTAILETDGDDDDDDGE